MVIRRRRRHAPIAGSNPALDAAAAASAAVAAAEAAVRREAPGGGSPDEPERPGPAVAPTGSRAQMARGDHRRPRASWIFPIRIALVAAIGVVLAALGGRAFDDVVPELAIGPLVVSAIALAMRRRRITERVAAEFAGVVVATLGAGLLTGSGGGRLLADLADGPRRLLTTEWPSPLDPGVVMTIAVLVTITTAVAADLAGRARFHVTPLAPVAAGFVGVMAVAAPVAPSRWLVVLLAVAAVLLLLARPGEDPRARSRLLVNERSLLATFAGLILATVVTSTAIAWTDRADPRQDVEADLTLALLDPVEQTAALRSVDPPLALFEITDRSALIGHSMPTRWRTSALTTYDGQRWLPAISLRPIGRRLGLPAMSGVATPPKIEFDLAVLTDDISLLPLPGRPLEVDTDAISITTDAGRTVVRLAEAPEPGLTVRVVSEVAPTSTDVDAAEIGTRQVDEIAGAFADAAEELGGDPTDTVLERLRRIETVMREEWQRDDDAPGAGQQLFLIEQFLGETNRGTREQFVTAFVLLARSIGVDARVATGFLVPPGSLDSPLVLRSSYATVWAEVRLGDRGWLAFDPVPPEQTDEDDQDPPPPSQQSPAAPQPPLQPPPNETDDSEPPDEETETTEVVPAWQRWAVRGALAGGGVLLPMMVLLGTIVVAKWHRRRRRLGAVDLRRRIVGVWANATDALVDAGLDILPSWTDEQIAVRGLVVAPGVPYDMRRLAVSATSMTFSSEEPTDAHLEDAVARARAIEEAIRSDRTRWQRLRWRLSTRSLRRRSRSPVAA